MALDLLTMNFRVSEEKVQVTVGPHELLDLSYHHVTQVQSQSFRGTIKILPYQKLFYYCFRRMKYLQNGEL